MKIIKLFGKKMAIIETDEQLVQDIFNVLIEAESAMQVVEWDVEYALEKDDMRHLYLTKTDVDFLKTSKRSIKDLLNRMIKLGLKYY